MWVWVWVRVRVRVLLRRLLLLLLLLQVGSAVPALMPSLLPPLLLSLPPYTSPSCLGTFVGAAESRGRRRHAHAPHNVSLPLRRHAQPEQVMC